MIGYDEPEAHVMIRLELAVAAPIEMRLGGQI
jgi:hypothetical protein